MSRKATRAISQGPSRAVTGPGAGGGGGGGDPYALAESYGVGIWDFEDASHYVTGGNGLYQLLDQTASQHAGTLSSRSGTGGDTNTVVAGSGPGSGYCRVADAAAERCMWLNGGVTADGVMSGVVICRTQGATGNPNFQGPWSHAQTTTERPWFSFNNSGILGNWQMNVGGGGSSDLVTHTEGSNVAHTNNPADNNWHCIAFLVHTSAGEGLMLDLDGEQLIPDDAAFTWTDMVTTRINRFSCFANDIDLAGGGGANLDTMDIGAIAWTPTFGGNTKAQIREIAEGLMARWGITSLAP